LRRWTYALLALMGALALNGCFMAQSSGPEPGTGAVDSTTQDDDAVLESSPVIPTASAPTVVPTEPPVQLTPALPPSPLAPAMPLRPTQVCAIGSAGWGLGSVTFNERAVSSLRNLGIGNEFDVTVSITVVNAANYPLTSSGVQIDLQVPTVRRPSNWVTVWFSEFAVPANSHATLTTNSPAPISTDRDEYPNSWSVSPGSRAGMYQLATPVGYDYASVCGVSYPQPFTRLN